jgi:hypothetical protein
LRRADHSSEESYRLCKNDYETEEEARAQQRAVEPLMNEQMNEYSNQSSVTVSSLGSVSDVKTVEVVVSHNDSPF